MSLRCDKASGILSFMVHSVGETKRGRVITVLSGGVLLLGLSDGEINPGEGGECVPLAVLCSQAASKASPHCCGNYLVRLTGVAKEIRQRT